MLVLFETPGGYAIFKLLDEKKLQSTENLYKEFETPERASKVVQLQHFKKFKSTTDAMAAATAVIESKMSKGLKKMLKKIIVEEAHEQLAVADAKLGNVIKEKLNINCVSNNSIQELMRCIRNQMDSLVSELPQKEMSAMVLGLAHSLSRYKLKFSPDKIDTMIIQAVSLLDDLDKELNNYIMRCREWYGWHFPELGKIVSDHLTYVKAVKLMGMRTNAVKTDFSDILTEDEEEKLKEAAEISMGTEISDDDITNISYLCEQVIDMTEYRAQLHEYLKNRIFTIAPNLSVLVGELVAARLISHAGSLMNLAKHPASTVQILGAEKALFRALKKHQATPKYGLIYHAQIIGQTGTKLKGRMSRVLAAKASLCTRVDALGEELTAELGTEHRAKVMMRLKAYEENVLRGVSGTGRQTGKFEKYHSKSEVMQYPTGADVTLPVKRKGQEGEPTPAKKIKVKSEPEDEPAEEATPKKKKKKMKAAQETEETPVSGKKKKIKEESSGAEQGEASGSSGKKKKQKLSIGSEAELETSVLSTDSSGKKKKKKKKVKEESD
jgi:nucleolar protein 58